MTRIGGDIMNTNCGCGGTCAIPIVFGIIAGILATLFLTVELLEVFLIITLGISLVALTVLTRASLVSGCRREDEIVECVCRNGVCLLVGLFGTLVSSIIAFITATLGPVLLFFVAGFFVWTLVSLFMLLLCIINTRCE